MPTLFLLDRHAGKAKEETVRHVQEKQRDWRREVEIHSNWHKTRAVSQAEDNNFENLLEEHAPSSSLQQGPLYKV